MPKHRQSDVTEFHGICAERLIAPVVMHESVQIEKAEPRFRLVLWLVYFLVSIIMIGQCVVVVGEWYYQDPAIHFAYKPLESIQLPHIYICPSYWMDKRKVARMPGMSDELLEYMRAGFLGFNNYRTSHVPLLEEKRLDAQYERLLVDQPDFDYRQFFHSIKMGYMGTKCWFEENKYACNAHFSDELTESGMCAYFNPNLNRNQTVEGPMGGLRFQIVKATGKDEPMVVRHSGFDNGIHLNIGGQWQPKIPDPIYIPPKVRAYISVQTTHIKAIRACTRRKKLVHFAQYSQAGCEYECKVNETLQQCNCTMFTYGIQNVNQSDFCSPARYKSCVWPIFKRTTNAECVRKNCIRECDQLVMRPSVSYTHYDEQRIQWYNDKYNRVGLNHGLIAVRLITSWHPSGYIMLHVYQSRIAVDQFWEEYSYTVADLISNIGGQMGLWLGLSLSTVLSSLLKCVYAAMLQESNQTFGSKPSTRTVTSRNQSRNSVAETSSTKLPSLKMVRARNVVNEPTNSEDEETNHKQTTV